MKFTYPCEKKERGKKELELASDFVGCDVTFNSWLAMNDTQFGTNRKVESSNWLKLFNTILC